MPSERVQRRIDSLLDRAELASDDSNWDQVLELTAGVLKVDPENADAQAIRDMAEASMDQAGSSPPPIPSDSATATVEDTPTSFANGRYQVADFLGEGGKKRVYLCRDTPLDRDVAFALIKAEGLDDASRQRVTREAQAMARLGDHPNLMPVFDMGQENNPPFLVQPYMPGGSIEDVIAASEDDALFLGQSIAVASQVLSGLQFAHESGIVHRDLKPGNIWLASDGTARIGDFGLALTMDRSRLTVESMMIGTVSYMPPEQATGGEATPKSDLYSLGAMLYEMVTGRPPFLGDDEIAIISQHVNTPPVAPAWLNSDVPAQLDTLILRLLEKDPVARPESAADVLTAIKDIDLSVMTSHEGDEAGSLDSMAGGVFVGRHQEMDQLKSELEKALSGRGGMMTLVGEPGIGKSRTAIELETYAGMRNAQVLWGRCYEEEGAPPYWPWVQAIRGYVRNSEPEALRSHMGSTASVIAEIVTDVKEQLPDIEPPPEIEEPNRKRFRLFDSITTFLKSAAEAKPLFLILDDLHWADRPTLLLLEFVARELASSRILLVGTYRDMELNRRHPLSVTLGDLGRERLFDRVILRGISKADVRRFIEIAAGINPPDALVESVYTQTEGNPLFVTETVRLFIQEGDLTPERLASTDSWTMRAPEGVTQAIGRRLDRLSERVNSVLTTAAVIGRQFTLSQLESIEDELSEDRLLDVLDEALAARVIEELPDEIGRYQFTHALIQQTLSDELSAARVVRLHARIAEALERLYGHAAKDQASELAHHFTEAEPVLGTEKILLYSKLAGFRSLNNYAYEDALAHFEQAIRLLGSGDGSDLRADMLEGMGLCQLAIGQTQAAADAFRTTFKLFEQSGEINRALRVARHPNPVYGDPEEAEMLMSAVKIAPAKSPDLGWVLSRLGMALGRGQQDLSGASKAFEQAIEIAKEHGDKRLEMWSLGRRSEILVEHMLDQEAMEAGVAGLLLSSEAQDPEAAFQCHDFAAVSALQMGHLEDAQVHAAGAISSAELSRRPIRIARAHITAMKLATLAGDFDAALKSMQLLRTAEYQVDSAPVLRLWLETMNGSTDEIEQSINDVQRLLNTQADQSENTVPEISISLGIAGLSNPNPRVPGLLGQAITEFARETSLSPIDQHVFIAANALIAILNSDNDAANNLLPASELLPGGFLHSRDSATMASDRLLGLLNVTAGNRKSAIQCFQDSLEFTRNCGAPVELARTCLDYSELLSECDDSGERAKASELQDEAIAIATELGMKPLLERVLAQREILKV